MNVLIIAYNQKEEVHKYRESLCQSGIIKNISVVLLEENMYDGTEQAEGYDFIIYMPIFNPQQSIAEIIRPLREYSDCLKATGQIEIHFPVAKVGERAHYSYEDIYKELAQKGFVLQNAKALSFTCNSEMVIGYSLSVLPGRKKRLLVLSSKNHLIEYNIKEIAEAYEELGWEIVYGTPEGSNIYKLLQAGIERLFIINNVGWISLLADSEKNVWDELKIPSMNYILDHPMYYDDTLSQAPKTGTLLCVDRNHVEYVKRFYPNINSCCFLPLAGDNQLDGIKKEWKDREIEVLYVGGYKGNLNLSLLPDGGETILKKMFQDMECTTESIIEQSLREGKESVSEEDVKAEIIKYKRLDWYIMTYVRVEAVRALVKGGINVTVYGKGWEAFEYFDDPHFIYKGSTSQNECLEQMKNSKIVLNVMPWFKAGCHDRVINAMLAGAVALSDGSAYMDEAFEAGKDYVAYDIKHLEQLPEIVREILSNDNSDMRNRAYRKANEKHRWIQHIAELESKLNEGLL